MKFAIQLVVLAVVLTPVVPAWNPRCISKPVGYGGKATGGRGGKVVRPRNIKELTGYLRSNGKLVIDLTMPFDFRGSEGYKTETGCIFAKCGKGYQTALDAFGMCNSRQKLPVKYSMAGKRGLAVSSDKTIMSSNGKGCLIGKGLFLERTKNVIIRDICIRDINAQTIWGGDAITFEGGQDVWVHNVHFSNVGRQFIVSHHSRPNSFTVSSCFFDGYTKYSTSCDGTHYWNLLLWGRNDQITLVNNHFFRTRGRLPHAGGSKDSNTRIHLIGNFMDFNPGWGIEANKGSYVLAEGNVYKDFKAPWNAASKGGKLAMVDSSADANECMKETGERCLTNRYIKSGSRKRFDRGFLHVFDRHALSSARRASCLKV